MTLKFPVELIINGDEWKIQPFRFNVHAINTGGYTPSYRDVTVTGLSPLNLPNAQANGLKTIKLFGKCEQTPNLFDKDKATLNYYINSSGEEQANASWSCSDYIEVEAGKTYNLSGVTSYGNAPRTGFYAADKSFVSASSQSSADFTIPDGVKYMRVSIYKASIDTAVVKQVLTFDKYTIVGNPTFNGDVVSGFSTSNYINATPNVVLGNNFEIIIEFKTGSDLSTDQSLFRMMNGSTFIGGYVLYNSTKEMRISFSDGTTGPALSGTFRVSENTHYQVRFVLANGTFNYYYKGDSDTDWVLSGTSSTTMNITTSTTSITLGKNNALTWGGSIDLKGFKIIANGVTTTIVGNPIPILCNNGEVGSTGYTVVGNPTITSDLVVSGFSLSNYITKTMNFSGANSWDVKFKVLTANDITTHQRFIDRIGSNIPNIISGILQNGKFRFIMTIDGTDIWDSNSYQFTAKANTSYDIIFGYDGTNYFVLIKESIDVTYTTLVSVPSSLKWSSATTEYIGKAWSPYWFGSIDLKEFKITVDGIPVRLPETVRIFGKNLFDQSQLLNATDWTLTDGWYTGLFSNFNAEFTNGFEIDVPFKEKTVYTLSCKGYVSEEGSRARFIFVYADESTKSLTIDSTTATTYTLTTPSTKTLAKIRGSYASGAGSTLYLKDIQLEEGSSATAFQSYHASPTAVARDLLSCGDDYVDEQNITTGEITRKVGYYIFDGTENWRKSASQPSSGIRFQANTGLANRAYGANLLGLCTHFNTVASSAIQQDINTFVYSTFNEYIFVIVDSNDFPTVDDWTSYVANLYAQGKPIIITYPLATPTTETVAAQNTLQNVEGLNALYITQSAIDGLAMEVTYSAGVEVTIEAVQNANVDQQVEVTIGE